MWSSTSSTLPVSFVIYNVTMATADDYDRGTLSNNTNILVPVSSDKTPLEWDGNDATILGLLFETGRYYRSKGLFQPLIRNRSVALSNGRLAVDDPNTVYFVTGDITENRSFDDPCPPTLDRLVAHNIEVALGTRGGGTKVKLTSVPPAHQHTIITAPHAVEKEDSTFLHSLSYVFGHAEPSDDLFERADGSGLELLTLLRDRGQRANARDKALVSTKFASLVRDGVKGELHLESFSKFLKAYKAARRNIAPASRPSADAEVEMISVIAIKDSATRELYELKTATSPPTTLDAAAEVLTGMLRGRLRCEEIDQMASGDGGLSLIAKKLKPPRAAAAAAASDAPAALLSALSAAGLDPSVFKPEQLAALVSALAPADPRRTGAGKVEIPRDKEGKPTKWVEGMALCRCGVNGGKHLFKDCPKAKEKREKEAKKKALAAAALAAEKTKADSATGPTEDQIRSALAAFFSGSVPTITLPGCGASECGHDHSSE